MAVGAPAFHHQLVHDRGHAGAEGAGDLVEAIEQEEAIARFEPAAEVVGREAVGVATEGEIEVAQEVFGRVGGAGGVIVCGQELGEAAEAEEDRERRVTLDAELFGGQLRAALEAGPGEDLRGEAEEGRLAGAGVADEHGMAVGPEYVGSSRPRSATPRKSSRPSALRRVGVFRSSPSAAPRGGAATRRRV